MDLEAITKLISMGNLLMYSFVTGCGIALRFRQRETQNSVKSPNEIWVWSYLIVSLFAVISLLKGFTLFLTVPLCLLTIGIIIKLTQLPQPNRPNSSEYNMPFVPLLPCLGIIGNNALVASFDGLTWFYYLIFTVIGTAIYFSYGINNSNL